MPSLVKTAFNWAQLRGGPSSPPQLDLCEVSASRRVGSGIQGHLPLAFHLFRYAGRSRNSSIMASSIRTAAEVARGAVKDQTAQTRPHVYFAGAVRQESLRLPTFVPICMLGMATDNTI